MQEYEQLGRMREVTVENDNLKMNYFLPHHVIYRPEKSTTKRHVPSNQNPADLISRGVDPDKLLNQELLWDGSEFLSGSDYPNETVSISENNDAYNSELKNSVREKLGKEVPVLNICVNDYVNNLCNISKNYLTILRILNYIFRFVNNARRKVKANDPLEADELDKVEIFLIKGVQSQGFSVDIKCLQQ
ncbi:uncharacterized protein TNCV_1333601 [Trichonephila clavipes]|nr:uncharacterized protein TNCV_1333601 [Trichonephila clavipes]